MADSASTTAGFAPVLAALKTMQGNVGREEKSSAHEFLEKFQKSVRQAPSIRQMRELTRK